MKDYMVRAIASDGQIRAFAITSKELVEQAREAHNTSPVATAALGRTLSAAAMMGMMSKNENDLLTLQLLGDGPIGGITVTANAHGDVKGLVNCPDVILPAKNGKLDVGGAIGIGFLRVIRDMGLKDPYVGDVALQTGEVAEDLTYYFATSEQTPSSVGLGVLMNAQNHVQEAGGFIVQLMPEVTEEVIAQLERNIAALSSVTEMLSQNMSPEDILNIVLEGLSPVMLETHPARFFCDCSKERIERSLAALGTEDMNDLISENKSIEVRCQFCNKRYEFGMEELKKISSNKK